MLRFMVSCFTLAVLNVGCWAQISLSLAAPAHSGGDGHMFPVDQSGVFFVLASKDVMQQSLKPLGPFCGWHSYGFAGKVPIKVVFIGDPDEDPSGCLLQNPSPNNNPAADTTASYIAHELAETVTDPELSAWSRTSDGFEMADLCEDTFGNTKRLPNGSSYNLQFGTRLYLVQRLWVNARGGYCALALDQ